MISRVNTTEKVLVKAAKSRNIYQFDKNDYKKYLRENITNIYKKSTKKRLNAVNKQAKKVAEKLKIDDRIGKIQETEAYITIKDRKKDFSNNLRQLAKLVSKRISETSSNEQIFKESIPIYEEALKKSGFHEKLENVREEVDKHGKEEKKRRKRKIIWFNPPYSNNVKRNVGKQFLKLVRRHFPKGHKLNKIFNKNTLKVS